MRTTLAYYKTSRDDIIKVGSESEKQIDIWNLLSVYILPLEVAIPDRNYFLTSYLFSDFSAREC